METVRLRSTVRLTVIGTALILEHLDSLTRLGASFCNHRLMVFFEMPVKLATLSTLSFFLGYEPNDKLSYSHLIFHGHFCLYCNEWFRKKKCPYAIRNYTTYCEPVYVCYFPSKNILQADYVVLFDNTGRAVARVSAKTLRSRRKVTYFSWRQACACFVDNAIYICEIEPVQISSVLLGKHFKTCGSRCVAGHPNWKWIHHIFIFFSKIADDCSQVCYILLILSSRRLPAAMQSRHFMFNQTFKPHHPCLLGGQIRHRRGQDKRVPSYRDVLLFRTHRETLTRATEEATSTFEVHTKLFTFFSRKWKMRRWYAHIGHHHFFQIVFFT